MPKLLPIVTDLPAMVGARVLAQTYLDQADEARKRVLGHDDEEALHDFRVAVRRLRSTVRAYRAHLDDTVKKRHRRWLRQMTRATNESRDLEVQLAWIASRRSLDDVERQGSRWLTARLKERLLAARAEALRAIRHDFPSGRDELRPVLSEYRGGVDLATPKPPSCGEAAGAAALVLTAQLESQLSAIRTAESSAEAHQARITGKRLRYLLEPFEIELAEGRALIQKLKRMQDALGALNDRAVLLERIQEESRALESEAPQSPNYAALATFHAFMTAQRDTLFLRIQQRWQAREARPLAVLLQGAATALLERRQAQDLEIERKFLLSSMPRLDAGAVALRIDQGWLPGKRLLERVRRVRTPNGTHWYRTVKSGAGVQRHEIEEETTEQVFRTLWRLTPGRRLSKRRYQVQDGALTWHIDSFSGRKLILAEVELPSAQTPLKPPDWLKQSIVREVTGDPAYLNVNLAS